MQLLLRRLDSDQSPRQVLSKRLSRSAVIGSRVRVSASAVFSAPLSELSKRSVVESSSVGLHRVAYQCGSSSPKNALSRVFSKSRRAARSMKFLRIAERFASLAFLGREGRTLPHRVPRSRVSEFVRAGIGTWR